MEKHYLRFSSSSSSPMMFLLSLLLFLSTRTVEGRETIPAMFIFGDSYTDQGNNNYLTTLAKANFLPYGKDFMGGDHPTGRFSNGKSIADFMAEAFGIKEYVPPYLNPELLPSDLVTGVSFGSGSTGYDPLTAATAGVLSIPKQLELFEEYIVKLKVIAGEDGSKNILNNSIFLIICGTNDIAGYFLGERQFQYTVDSYTDFLVDIASNFTQNLQALGAGRIYIFGAPPVGCVPFQRTLKGGVLRNCSTEENEAAQLYNNKLSNALTTLNDDSSDSNATIAYVDYYNPVYNLIQNYTEYGFTVADRGCCGTGLVEISFTCNPTTSTCEDDLAYIFWDSYHYTEQGNRLLVNQFLQNSFSDFLESLEGGWRSPLHKFLPENKMAYVFKLLE